MSTDNGSKKVSVTIAKDTTANVTGPGTAELQPGASVSPVDQALKVATFWSELYAKSGAIGVIAVLFASLVCFQLFLYWDLNNKREADIAAFREQVSNNSSARSAELKAFRDWTEARLDKQQEREDAMRSKLWASFSAMAIDLKILLQAHNLYGKSVELKKGQK